MSRAYLYGWPFAAVAVLALAAPAWRGTWLMAFFTFILLWPASLVVARIAGERAGLLTSTLCLGLLLAQVILPPPVFPVDMLVYERPFEHQGQVAQHTLRLPVDDRGWLSLWSRSPEPEAYVYVSIANRRRPEPPPLMVSLNGRELGAFGAGTRAAPQVEADKEERVWHRLRVPRADLEYEADLQIEVRPLPSLVPAAVGVIGGYSYRPTRPPAPSAFFDGTMWSTEPSVMLPVPGRSPALLGPMRYFIELRVVDPVDRRFLAIYY
jgi:hypothetical protein